MSIRIAVIGAGSLTFTRTLVHDILSVPELQDTRFALQDISARNLSMTAALLKKDISSNGLPARILTTRNQREAITGADYVICLIRQGGLEAFETDISIPLEFGVDQCVGDTLGPGGIMYAQRGIPALLSICRDMRETAKPDALLLNYSNPMAMMTWAANKYGGVKMLGLCHGVQGGHHQIAQVLGVEPEKVDYTAAGINHQTWFIRIKAGGREISGAELLKAFEAHPVHSEREKVRIDVLRRFGYYSTESNGHLSEYLPWYRKRPREIKRWIHTGNWINGETGGYLRHCRENRDWFKKDFPKWKKETSPEIGPGRKRSHEHGSYIIEALETGRVYRGHFNMVNHGTIGNLPADCIVEVPGYVDANGINTPRVGDLPLACAATVQASVNVQRMAVEAAVHGDDTLLRQAMLHDPLTGAVCNPEEVWEMTDRMLAAGSRWLPQYRHAVLKARKKIKRPAPSAVRTKKTRVKAA